MSEFSSYLNAVTRHIPSLVNPDRKSMFLPTSQTQSYFSKEGILIDDASWIGEEERIALNGIVYSFERAGVAPEKSLWLKKEERS